MYSLAYCTWIYGILWTNLVYWHVNTARKITCFLYVYSLACCTWIYGILWTNLVCRHVVTARESHVFCTCIHLRVVREFTGFCEKNWCIDTWLPHAKSRVFCTCIHLLVVREFSPLFRTCIHGILWKNMMFLHVFPALKLRVSVCKIICFPHVYSHVFYSNPAFLSRVSETLVTAPLRYYKTRILIVW